MTGRIALITVLADPEGNIHELFVDLPGEDIE